jgi:undecaprenyl-diphosphatase
MIAFSRMYLYVHYPTDIIGGVVVGIVSGYLGYVLANK